MDNILTMAHAGNNRKLLVIICPKKGSLSSLLSELDRLMSIGL
jgi:hypothetical protein